MSDNAIATAASLRAISGSFIALCTISVALRFYARKRQKAPLLTDDWCMFAALISVLGYLACTLAIVEIGWIGWGTYRFPESELISRFKDAQKTIVVGDIFMQLAFVLTKASALFLYRRIFCSQGSINRTFNRVLMGTLVVISIWLIPLCFLSGYQCHGHLLAAWNPIMAEKYCTLSDPYGLMMVVTDLIFDLWVILLPIPSILRLRLLPSQKIKTIGVFLVALAGIAASLVRLVDYLQVVTYKTVHLSKSKPELLTSVLYFYNVLEIGMILISINIPVLWSIFSSFAPELVTKLGRSMTSLASRSSEKSQRSQSLSSGRPRDGSQRRFSESSSTKNIYTGGKESNDVYVMHEVVEEPLPDMPRDQILMNHSYHVSSHGEPQEV